MAESSSSALLSVRVDAQAVELLNELASQDRISAATALEKLIFAAARLRGLLSKDDPALAFVTLLDEAAKFLDSRPSHGGDITLEWFQHIAASPRLAAIHERAVRPPNPRVAAQKRRQYVHQRIGRFVKEYLGFVSVKEIVLPRDAGELIRSYTKLARS